MADRTLVEYEEERNEDGPHWTLEIQRSASGQPDLLFTIKFRMHDGSLPEKEMTIVVKDADTVLTPAMVYLQERRNAIGKCSCDWTTQDAGGGYFEPIAELNPSCPVHSHHVYNPRTNMWELAGE